MIGELLFRHTKDLKQPNKGHSSFRLSHNVFWEGIRRNDARTHLGDWVAAL